MTAQESRECAAVDGEQKRIEEAVRDFNAQRATIEQAKGMLMFVYGVGENVAFETLSWMSQQYNVKLRALAGQIVTDFVEWSQIDRAISLVAADRALLAAAEHRADLDTLARE